MNRVHDVPVGSAILDEAAAWLMQLHSGESSEADRIACAQWRQRSPEHARAWERAERLLARLGGLPPELAGPALGRAPDASRRRALKQLGLLLAATPVVWAGWQGASREWLADRRTAVGEQHVLDLPDGSRLTLNTASAVDLRFGVEQRLVALLQGEILVEAPTAASPLLQVSTEQGLLSTRSARFSVRQDDGRTRLAVLDGAVQVQPLQGAPLLVQAGQGSVFDAAGRATRTLADAGAVAWTRGMLMADRMPLAEFAAELARYRRGIVRCDPQVAGLLISGAYPLLNRERTLAMLQATYPVRVSALTGYWITLSAAA
ncbi:FecR family protein [Pseudomonas sp. PDM14]|uniref:FecR domain-containing protein n=1 Tax=Pseudomonas sp. PDM14 TaxID=2769288 RepID=UPI001782B686|nr:FecR family protein [Pseudomonas sp. PDM14]MBD9483658.1 FecR family protein [Pseudomonas sp. PDM14]